MNRCAPPGRACTQKVCAPNAVCQTISPSSPMPAAASSSSTTTSPAPSPTPGAKPGGGTEETKSSPKACSENREASGIVSRKIIMIGGVPIRSSPDGEPMRVVLSTADPGLRGRVSAVLADAGIELVAAADTVAGLPDDTGDLSAALVEGGRF